MFGSPLPQPTGYMGLDGLNPGQQMPTPQPAPQKNGGMFGGKVSIDLGRALAGYLAGIGNPAGAQALQAMNEDRRQRVQHQQELDDYNRKRADDNADFVTQLQEKAQYEPKEPHYFQDNAGNQMAIGPDGNPVEVYHDPLQYKFVPNGMGGVVPVNIQSLMGGAAPTKPVGRITPIDGGPTQPASGGFPR